jgi:tRNA threonylcarbamoyladenosine biosynthesis protein TsaB
VALLEGRRLLGEQVVAEPPHRASTLLASVDQLLSACGRELAWVDAIALSIGPGSFTGLRIGLGTALGLCFDTERQIVPVPTLAALSLHASGSRRVAPLLDARKGQVYAGLYGAGAVPLLEDRVTDPLRFLELIKGSGPVALLGPGARLYQNEIETLLGGEATLLPALLGSPRPATVGLLGAELLAAGRARSPEEVELRYLRASDAELARRPVDTPERNP